MNMGRYPRWTERGSVVVLAPPVQVFDRCRVVGCPFPGRWAGWCTLHEPYPVGE